MAWIFMLIGLVLGAGLDASISGALLGALLGLSLGQMVELAGLRAEQRSQDAQLKQLTARLILLERRSMQETSAGTESHNSAATADTAKSTPMTVTPPAPAQDLAWDLPALGAVAEQTDPAAHLEDSRVFEEASTPVALPTEPVATASEPSRPLKSAFETIKAAPLEQSSFPEPNPLSAWVTAAKNWLLGGNIMLRVGLLLLFLGLAFLLRYAAGTVVVPLFVRYLLVALTGVGLIGLGWWLAPRRRDYALLLQGTGIGVIYLTCFVAMRLHPLLTSAQALSFMVLVTLFCVALALWQNALGLAVAATLGGFAAPILASSGEGSHIALFSYFTLLNLGIFTIAWFKAWRLLNLVGFIGTFGIGLAWGLRSYQAELFASTEPFLLLSFLLYLGIALLFSRRRLLEAASLPAADERMARVRWGFAQTDYIDASLLFGVPLTGFGLQCAVVAHIEYGAAYSALALGLLYLALVALLRNSERLTLLTESCLALGVIFISLAIPLAFDARWTSAAWAVQGAGIYWLGMRQQRPFARMFAALLQGCALFAFLRDLESGYDPLLKGGAPLGALMLGGSLLFVFWQQRQAASADLRQWEVKYQPLFAVLGLCLLYLIAPLFWGSVGTALAFALAGLVTLLAGLQFALRSFVWTAAAVQWAGGGIFFMDNAKAVFKGLAGNSSLSLMHSSFWLPLVLALAALLSALLLHQAKHRARLPRLLLGWSVLWWVLAAIIEVQRFVPELASRVHLLLWVATLSALLWSELARLVRWLDLARLALLLFAVAWLLFGMVWHEDYQPLSRYGALVWPVLFAVQGWILWRLERADNLIGHEPLRLAHLLGCWLLLAVLWMQLSFGLSDFSLTWRGLGWALLPCAFLALMASPCRLPWPVANWQQTYRLIASAPIALWLLAWLWWMALNSNGNAAPLPYLPLLNPLEIGLLLVLVCLFQWVRQSLIRQGLPPISAQPWLLALLGLSLWMLLSMAVCRSLHQFIGVPFNPEALRQSMPVQAGLSLVWSTLALTLMVGGHLRRLRFAWLVGAALMGLVVAKLFLVELAASGTLARIVSFIGVGVLLLIVGYFAPLPPREPAKGVSQ